MISQTQLTGEINELSIKSKIKAIVAHVGHLAQYKLANQHMHKLMEFYFRAQNKILLTVVTLVKDVLVVSNF